MTRHGVSRALALLAAATATAAGAQAQAPAWRVVTIDGDGEHGASVAYVDTAALVREGDEVRFNMLVRFQDPPPGTDQLRGRMRADCAGRRWGADGSAFYLGDTLIREMGPVALERVAPGTNAANVVEGVCTGRYLSDPVEPESHSRDLFRK
jgi:hypothetical protein